MSRILITGAGGFIGRELCRHAADAGHEVHALVRRRTDGLAGVSQIVAEITEVSSDHFPDDVDAVVHLASGTSGSDEEVIRVAREGTVATFRAAAAAGVPKFVHVSSLSVYPGRIPAPAPPQERGIGDLDGRPQLRGAYAASKIHAERALWDCVGGDGASGSAVTVVRPGLVFGPGMAAPLAGTAALAPLGLAMLQGRASQHVPLIDSDDLCHGLVALLESSEPWPDWRVYDLLPEALPTKRELVDEFARASGQPARAVELPRAAIGTAATLVDRIRRSADSPTRYKVDRAYEFEPAELPAADFWREVGATPKIGTGEALRDALTFAGPVRNGGAVAGSAGEIARDLLAVEAAVLPAPTGDWILLGAGRVVQELHGPALEWLGGNVVAVIDTDRASAEAAAAQLPSARAATSLAELPASLLEGANAVIATPGSTHERLALDAIERGCHPIVEKPPALGAAGLGSLREAAAARGTTVSAIQNYRLRRNVAELWKFLDENDVGTLLRAQVEFHTGSLLGEPARWMRAEREHRTLLFELGIHFVDVPCLIGGGLSDEPAVEVVPNRAGDGLATATASGRLEHGAIFELGVSAGGPARRTAVSLEFERSAVELSFFPEGFRVLPPRRTPIDDIAASVRELGSFIRLAIQRRRRGGVEHSPHRLIYAAHNAARAGASNPFSLDSTQATISTLEMIGDGWYGK